jgi:glyoxylase-like metal-dependent hydrolase (beta-lactamase superfamily II)
MLTQRRTLLLAGGATLAAPALLRRPALAQPAAAPAAAQAPGWYRFKLGGLTVTMVHDGFGVRPLEGFVLNKPLAEVQQVLRENFLPDDRLAIPYTITFVETSRGLICFDTGNGVTAPGATNGNAIANMAAAGIDPARVTTVVMSHFHGDHVNGLLNGAGAAAFPNAEVVVPETEWKWWTEASNETRSPTGQRPNFANTARRFAPYQGKVRVIGDSAEALPGVRAVPAHGHTPGHTCYLISDGNAQLMFVADCTNRPMPLALHPDYHIIFDFEPNEAVVARRRIYDQVATDRIPVTGYHFPFPAYGHLVKEGAGFRFLLADWASAV